MLSELSPWEPELREGLPPNHGRKYDEDPYIEKRYFWPIARFRGIAQLSESPLITQ